MLSKCGPQNPNRTKLSDTRRNDGMLILMWFVLPVGGHNGTNPSLSFPFVEWSPSAAPSPVASTGHWRAGSGEPARDHPSPTSLLAPEILSAPEDRLLALPLCLPQAPDTCPDLNVT